MTLQELAQTVLDTLAQQPETWNYEVLVGFEQDPIKEFIIKPGIVRVV